MKRRQLPIFGLMMLTIAGLAGCGQTSSSSSSEGLSSELPSSVASSEQSSTPSSEVSSTPSSEASSTPSSEPEVVPTSITITAEKTTIYEEEVIDYVVSVLPENAANKAFTLAVEDDTKIAVNQTEKTITGLLAGSSKITVTTSVGGLSDDITIVVEEVPDPEFVFSGEKSLTVAAGVDLTLPAVTAIDYDDTDLTADIEVEDLAENGTIVGNVFNAKIAGEHTLSYYVETEDGRYAEDEVVVNVTPITPETFDVTGVNDVSIMGSYGVFKENFERGRKSPLYAITDSQNAAHLSALDDAILGNSLIIDANKTAGSANNCVFFNAFNDHFQRGVAVTYKASFSYKILSSTPANFSNFYFGLSWDGFDGLNNTFINGATATQGTVYEYSATFPAATIPMTGNAYFRFFKLSGSASDAIIAIDNFTFETVETAQVTKVVPTSEQLLAAEGFTWNWADKGSGSTNGETVIIANIENETAKNVMAGNEAFGANALKLTNADSHVFEGLTKDNLVVGRKLVVDFTYYAVSNNGFHIIMMGDNGNPTLAPTVTNEGQIFHVHVEAEVLAGWYAMNIYGAGNPAFEIYLGEMNAKLTEPDPIVVGETPNGHKVGDAWSITSRQWGNQDKTTVKTEAFDAYAPAIENTEMGTAPTKFTWNGDNTNMEWFQAGGKIETGMTYEITATYYVVSWTEGARFMYNFDNNVFLSAGSTTVGFHQETITWVATRTVDFFSIYVPEQNTGVLYLASINVELTVIPE